MPDSKSPYIIICNGRIEVDAATKVPEKIRAASNAAMNLVQFYELHGAPITVEDTTPISDLQHEMMDNLKTLTKSQANAVIAQMFALLDALEEKFD